MFFIFVSCLPEDILIFKADMANTEMPHCLIGTGFIILNKLVSWQRCWATKKSFMYPGLWSCTAGMNKILPNDIPLIGVLTMEVEHAV